MPARQITTEEVLIRARIAGITIDDDQLETVRAALERSLGSLEAFDLRENAFSEPAIALRLPGGQP